MTKVDTLDKCRSYLDRLRLNGWRLWQMQYSYDHEFGFHAWFMKAGKEDIELVTWNKEVQDEIVRFNDK
jgi:hypothetical protein